uniref:Polysaccharide efflux transporter, putative n=1 Tax=Chlorobium chlorochromatii (strain CaD3) TaxID=340177 RepID=Q3APG3_CHLCH
MSRNSLVAGQAGFAFAGLLFGQLMRFGYNLVVARLLGVEALGIYALAIAVMQVAEVVALAGCDASLLRFVNLYHNDAARQRQVIGFAAKSSLLFSLAVMALLMLFANQLSALFHGNELLTLALSCYAAALPFNVLTQVTAHALQAFQHLKPKIIATQLLSPLLLLLFTLLFYYTVGIQAALLMPFLLSACGALLWILLPFATTTGIRFIDIVRARHDNAMLTYALPLMAVSLFSMLSHWLDVMMLGIFSDAVTVGLYHPAARTAGLLRSVLLAFAGIAAPLFAELHAQGNKAEMARLYKLVTRWSVILLIPPLLIFMVLPQQVLSLFGAHFADSGAVALQLLSAAYFVQCVFGIASTLLAMSGYAQLSLINAVVALALQAGLNWLFIPTMGLQGAAVASLVLFLLLSALRWLEVRLLLQMNPLSTMLWKPLVAGAVTFLLLMLMHSWLLMLPSLLALGVGTVIAFSCYVALMLMLKLEVDEKEIIFKYLPFMRKDG